MNRDFKRPEELLQAASIRHRKQWPGMSLRAVASRLEISPGYWSKILRGQKTLPQHLLGRVVEVLGMDPHQIAELHRSILKTIETEEISPATGLNGQSEAPASPVMNYVQLDRADFWLLEEWYLIPILNFVTLETETATTELIAKRLGITLKRAEESVARLVKARFLETGDSNELKRTDQKIRFPTDRSFPSIRRYHRDMIKLAGAHLDSPNSSERYDQRQISAVCFAGSSEKLKEARLILEEAIYRAANLMADEPTPDQVYQLNLQLFPLTHE